MTNLAYFEVPAVDIQRAIQFYQSVLGWKIERDQTPGIDMEYYSITTGAPMEGTLNTGGMYKRQEKDTAIRVYAKVDDVNEVVTRVEQNGGGVMLPPMEIPNVGWVAIIIDSEGNPLGVWKPALPGS
jgi:Predicted enzyme related to lactoylglutathione lyase